MAENVYLWSITASDNDDADPAVPWPENMLPGAVNNAARSTMAAVARLLADINGTLATTGSANVYAVTCNSGVTAFTNGQLVTVKANFTNSAAATLNLNSLGAKAIRVMSTEGEIDVIAGQIRSGGTYQFRYDSAANSASGAWLLLNPTPQIRTGEIKIWSTDTAPGGYYFCNGQALSRTSDAALFGVIGTTYGVGDGSTTFNVPDLRGRAPFGSDDMGTTAAGRITNAGSSINGAVLATSGGTENITLNSAHIPSHTHGVSGNTGTESAHTHTGSTTVGEGLHTHSGTTGTESQTHTHSLSVPSGYIGQLGTSSASAGVTPTSQATGTESQTHTHDISIGSSGTHIHSLTTGAGSAHSHPISITTDGGSGGSTAHNNMPPLLIVNYIIKN